MNQKLISEENLAELKVRYTPSTIYVEGLNEEVPTFEDFNPYYMMEEGKSAYQGDVPNILRLVARYVPAAQVFGIHQGGTELVIHLKHLAITIQLKDFKIDRILCWDYLKGNLFLEENAFPLEDILQLPLVQHFAEFCLVRKALKDEYLTNY